MDRAGDSDLLTIYNAYCSWRRVCNTTGTSEAQFCRKNFLSSQNLQSIEELKGQLTACLVDAGFLYLDADEKAALSKARSYSFHRRNFVSLPPASTVNDADLIVNSVIAWSFYPKLLVRDGKGWRNAANNQTVSLHPSSVNKGIPYSPSMQYLSFYHIMQSGSGKAYNAHETSPVEAFAIALACGDAEFRMYAGVVLLDGHRFKFKVDGWRQMLALKILRAKVVEMLAAKMKAPGRDTGESDFWWNIWRKVFVKELET